MLMKLLVFLHRWLGIALGLFFAMWFFTGIVMMYVPFPSLSDADRLTYLSVIDTGQIAVSPGEAMAMCGSDTTDGLRLISIQARPAYVCSGSALRVQAVYADVAARVPPLSAKTVMSIVRVHVNEPIEHMSRVEYDQWIVHQRFDPLRPFYRLEVQDNAGTHFYVSSLTGEIAQRTTRPQRFWNYLGAVAHWIYPTVLRKHWAVWDAVVWWLSAFGILSAISGVYLGVSHWVKLRRSGQTALSPFSGWMKSHHILGLFSGVIVVSWIVSGWLSMDHGRLFSVPAATSEQMRAVQGLSLSEAGKRVSVKTLAGYQMARELTLHAFGSSEIIVAKNEQGVVDTPELDPEYIADVIDSALPDTSVVGYGVVPDRDTYTHLREGQLPPGTVRVELSDPGDSWLHIDAHSGEILSVLDRSRRVYRWLFNGLHSLDFPGLVEKRPLWDGVMLLLLVAGLFTSIAGVVVGSKRLARMLSQ